MEIRRCKIAGQDSYIDVELEELPRLTGEEAMNLKADAVSTLLCQVTHELLESEYDDTEVEDISEIQDRVVEEYNLTNAATALYNGEMFAFIRKAYEELLASKPHYYRIWLDVKCSIEVKVKADSEEDARDYANNLESTDIVDLIDPYEWGSDFEASIYDTEEVNPLDVVYPDEYTDITE